jgi:hypothetical protein
LGLESKKQDEEGEEGWSGFEHIIARSEEKGMKGVAL